MPLIDRMLRWLPRICIRRPLLALSVMGLLVLLALPGLSRLQLRTDGHALVPPDDPAILFDEQVRRHFDLRDSIVVYIRSDRPEGIYNPDSLRGACTGPISPDFAPRGARACEPADPRGVRSRWASCRRASGALPPAIPMAGPDPRPLALRQLPQVLDFI